VVKYYKYIYKVAFSFTKNRREAEDLAHDSIEKALKSNYEEKNIKAWLFTVVKSMFINEYRRKKGKFNVELTESNRSVENECWGKFIKEDLYNKVKKLDKQERKIIFLRVKGYKYDEISGMFNMNINTFKTTLLRIKKKII